MDEKDDLRDSGKLLEIELAQSIETFRSILDTVITAFGILIAANVGLLGYATTNQKALLIGIAAVFPLAGLAMLIFTGRMIVPALYTGLAIENRIKDQPDLFFWALVAVMARSSLAKLESILALEDPQERLSALRRFGGYMPFGFFTVLGLVALAACQVIAAPVLVYVFNWSWV